MPVAMNPNATRDYTLKGDKSGTIFKIGVVDSFTRSYLEPLLSKIQNQFHLPLKVAQKKLLEARPADAALITLIDNLQASYDKKQATIDPNDEARFFFELLRHGLKGWEKFLDAEGKPVEFKTVTTVIPNAGVRTVASDESLNYLKARWMKELAIEIHEDTFVSDQELKN